MKQDGLLRCPWTEMHSESRIPACETPPGRGAGPQGRQPARKGGTGWALGAKAGAKTPLLPHSPDRPACQSPRDGQASVSALLRPRAEQLCGQEAGKERLPGKPRLPCDTAEGGGTNGERLGVEGPRGVGQTPCEPRPASVTPGSVEHPDGRLPALAGSPLPTGDLPAATQGGAPATTGPPLALRAGTTADGAPNLVSSGRDLAWFSFQCLSPSGFCLARKG